MADFLECNINQTKNNALNEDALDYEFRQSALKDHFDGINRDQGSETFTVNFIGERTQQQLDDALVIVQNHEGVRRSQIQVVELSTKTPSGYNEIAITKPDGQSKTFISHNFCDKTTWSDPNDSLWGFVPVGAPWKIYKAEVQFTKDVMEGFNTDATKEMYLDVIAGGFPVPSESKIFKTVFDIYDLGNKHYETNIDISVAPSMGGGVVTVLFDYTDVIVLDPAMLMAMHFHTKNHEEMPGTHCSVSLVAGVYG